MLFKRVLLFLLIILVLFSYSYSFAFIGVDGKKYPDFPSFFNMFDSYIFYGNVDKNVYRSVFFFNSTDYHLEYRTRLNGGKNEHFLTLVPNDFYMEQSAAYVDQVRLPSDSSYYHYGSSYWDGDIYKNSYGGKENECLRYYNHSEASFYEDRGYLDILVNSIFYNKDDLFNSIIRCNTTVVDNSSGDVIYEGNEYIDKFSLELYLEPPNLTVDVPVVIHTQNFSDKGILKYYLEYSVDNKTWSNAHMRSFSDGEGHDHYQFYVEVLQNGHYYFRLFNPDTQEYIYKDIEVSNIVVNQDNVNNYIDGVFNPTPFLSYEYIDENNIVITTQKFFGDEWLQLECSYAKDISNEDLQNDSKWTNVSTRSYDDTFTDTTTYQFYLNVSNSEGTADGNYYFRFYNKTTKKYTYGNIDIIFSEIIKYNKVVSETSMQLQRFLDFFSERFGFLTYPFELVINILTKISNIDFEEPRFEIPDINEPFTNTKLVSATNYNFNNMLDNAVLQNVHNIYFIVVDVIIVFALVNLAKNKIMGVLGGNG